MSLKGFLALVLFTDILAWGAWGVLLTTTTPAAGYPIIALFYLSLLLALLGFFAVIGFVIRVYIQKRDELIVMYVRRTFRQATLLSVLFVISLMLLHYNFLRWWVVLLLIAAIGLLEQQYVTLESRR